MALPVREGTASGGSSFTSAPSCSLGCGTNSNRGVLAFVFTERGGATTINSATCNGNAMTASTAHVESPSGFDARAFWIAGDSNIATGSNTVTATLSDANTKPAIIAVAYSGVDGTTPVSGETYAEGFSANATWTVSSATGDLVVALFAMTPSRTLTAGTDTTIFFGPTVVNVFPAVMMEEAGASSTTINATWTSNSEWFGFGFSLKAASGGISGAASITLGNVTTSAAGAVAVAGAAAITLADVTTTAAGQVALAGAAAITLADVTSSAAGAVALKGALAATLADVTLAADSLLTSGRTGGAAITIADVTVSAAGALPLQGVAAITLADVTLTAGSQPIETEPGRLRLGMVTIAAQDRRLGMLSARSSARRLGQPQTGP